jgi:hypothetical protein
MNGIARLGVFFMLVFTLCSAGVHKFYVAVFQLEYVAQKKVVQITSRIFIDDLEATLNKKYNKKLNIGSSKELAEANDLLRQYLNDNIHIKINGKLKAIKLLGKETEDDVLICYYTVPADAQVKSVEMKNTVLFEAFTDQQNIIHTKVNGDKKSLLLTNDNPSGIVEFK